MYFCVRLGVVVAIWQIRDWMWTLQSISTELEKYFSEQWIQALALVQRLQDHAQPQQNIAKH